MTRSLQTPTSARSRQLEQTEGRNVCCAYSRLAVLLLSHKSEPAYFTSVMLILQVLKAQGFSRNRTCRNYPQPNISLVGRSSKIGSFGCAW